MSKADDRKFLTAASFVEALKDEGIVLPADEEYGMGMTPFLEALEAQEDQRPFDYIRAFLIGLQPQVILGEAFPGVVENDNKPLPKVTGTLKNE